MKKMRILSGIILFIIATSMFISSCKKSEAEPAIVSEIKIISGNQQIALANGTLPNPVIVKIIDKSGNLMVGATVNLEPSDGTVSKSELITDSQGNVSVEWTLGVSASTQNLRVKVLVKAETYLSASIEAYLGSANVELTSGDMQIGVIEAALQIPIEVIVKDIRDTAYTNGAIVNFTVSQGSVSETSVTTDEEGKASIIWIAGSSIGTQTLNVTALQADGITILNSIIINATLINNKVTDYDNNTYKIVKIGEQIWMAENLKVTHYTDGATIPYITGDTEWANLGDNDTDKAYCYYNNNANGEKDTYGALYTWAAAMNGAGSSIDNPSGVQGVCPTGWHVPSIEEWRELQIFIGMSESDVLISGWRGTHGSKLKETGTTHWNEPNTGATNEFDFSALPSGKRNAGDGSFFALNEDSGWLTSSAFSSNATTARGLNYDTIQMGNLAGSKSGGYSVRCIKD